MKKIIILACLTLILMSFSWYLPNREKVVVLNKFSDPVIREIVNLKNERKTFQILPYLYHVKAPYREEAAMAYASLQDTVVLNYLLPLLNDTDAGVRKATAFAIGQIGDDKLEGNLLNAFYAEKNDDIKATLLKTMGKCANERILISFNMLNLKDTVVRAGLAWGIYHAGLKGVSSETILNKSIKLLDSQDSEQTRLAVAHYLARTKNLNLLPFESQISAALDKEKKSLIKMPLCMALAKTNSEHAEATLHKIIANDADHRVKISAVKALEVLEKSKVSKEIYKVLYDKNINTALAAAEFVGNKVQVNDVDEILSHAEKIDNWRINSILLTAVLKSAPNKILEDKIWNRYRKSKNQYEKGQLLKALAYNAQNNKDITKEIFQSKDPVLKTLGMEALAEVSEKGIKKDNISEYFEIFKRAIESEDIAMMGIAAQIFRNPAIDFERYLSNPTFLFQARDKLNMPKEIETYQEIQKTIDYVTQTKSNPHPITLQYAPVDWDLITSLSNTKQVVVKTTKGDFVVELLVEDAPGTVSNFLKLSNKNFYNGKSFHRVVPNFVVQGGDPRGDGWGSSESLIRSEFNYNTFKEGYIGMASAGKDTESCQWFIMHAPAPHLDGNYTNFAKVISGMNVVHQLEVGDQIKSIESR